ncbi:hypothetical protein EDB19DRAFT_1984164 [Suillus lakei]|nr:hypothetical protein EDB19DRAFT_1984164 [Suillus lakei]
MDWKKASARERIMPRSAKVEDANGLVRAPHPLPQNLRQVPQARQIGHPTPAPGQHVFPVSAIHALRPTALSPDMNSFNAKALDSGMQARDRINTSRVLISSVMRLARSPFRRPEIISFNGSCYKIGYRYTYSAHLKIIHGAHLNVLPKESQLLSWSSSGPFRVVYGNLARPREYVCTLCGHKHKAKEFSIASSIEVIPTQNPFITAQFTSGFRHSIPVKSISVDQDVLDAAATRTKAKSTVLEEGTQHILVTSQKLLTGILRGLGSIDDVPRHPQAHWDDTTLERSALGRTTYKLFMLFFMAKLTTLARLVERHPTLHVGKDCAPPFQAWILCISGVIAVVGVVTSEVRSILEGNVEFIQDAQRVSPRWAPETLQNQRSSPKTSSFDHSHHMRGTIDHFLDAEASFLVAAHTAEPSLALEISRMLFDQGLTNGVPSAYSSRALDAYKGNPENLSVMLITLFKLWVAIDKIVVGQIPITVEYSPEIPMALWECLLIRESAGLDRLKELHAYLKGRHYQASSYPPTNDTKLLAVRYFYQSPKLQSWNSATSYLPIDQVMDIIPADILGMEYATRGNICDHESVLTVFAGPDIDKIFAMQASIVSTSGNFTSIWQMTDGYAYELATLEISEDGVDQSITSESPRCGYSNNHSINTQ